MLMRIKIYNGNVMYNEYCFIGSSSVHCVISFEKVDKASISILMLFFKLFIPWVFVFGLVTQIGAIKPITSIKVMIPKSELFFTHNSASNSDNQTSHKLGVKLIENFAKKCNLKIEYVTTNETLSDVFGSDCFDNITKP